MKKIPGFEMYSVDTNGDVWNTSTGKKLKPYKNNWGYLYVTLHNAGNIKRFFIHRLVASAYITNENNYPEINHKDENKENNDVSNLEWCTRKYNNNYGTRNEKASMSLGKRVFCVDLNETFYSSHEAQKRTGVHQGNIIQVCRGHRRTAGGYRWSYARYSL